MRVFNVAIIGLVLASQLSFAQSGAVEESAMLDDGALWAEDGRELVQAENNPVAESVVSPKPTSSPEVLSVPSNGPLPDSQHLGFVNLRRVMGSAPQLMSIRSRLDGEFAAQQEALQTQSNDLAEMEKRLSGLPRGEEYSALEEQIIALRRDFSRAEASFRDAYSVRRNEELAKLQQLVVDQIVELAKDDSYQFILNENSVIFASNEVDLTDKVISRLQKIADTQ
ncbi:OmpH family outer membrane protein [Suttonella sp. R2A3]|uniref:OmpH family outer membrane protein n=1 Tax=Suttonella sp. R2A3 TaxID=2908648 RepID=UPI001F3E90E7|nr:OmpH family outer membrane protein [Suttonella sp. R2A3]UJF24823.1 OmpH family outer membrane protein [Suttonella sp. R2A3]